MYWILILQKIVSNLTITANRSKLFIAISVLLVLSLISILFFDAGIFAIISSNLYYDDHVINILHNHLTYRIITSEELLLCVAGFFSVFTFIFEFRKEFSKFNLKLLFLFATYQSICLYLLNYIKLCLKYVFARCVPEVCLLHKLPLSFLPYGFNFFSLENGFVSFPSGHCMILSYALIWSFCCNSYLKVFMFISFLIVFISLVVFNYHFLGDCFAGTGFGLMFGYISMLIWKIIQRNYFLR